MHPELPYHGPFRRKLLLRICRRRRQRVALMPRVRPGDGALQLNDYANVRLLSPLASRRHLSLCHARGGASQALSTSLARALYIFPLTLPPLPFPLL